MREEVEWITPRTSPMITPRVRNISIFNSVKCAKASSPLSIIIKTPLNKFYNIIV